jgi:hypothetical protein
VARRVAPVLGAGDLLMPSAGLQKRAVRVRAILFYGDSRRVFSAAHPVGIIEHSVSARIGVPVSHSPFGRQCRSVQPYGRRERATLNR